MYRRRSQAQAPSDSDDDTDSKHQSKRTTKRTPSAASATASAAPSTAASSASSASSGAAAAAAKDDRQFQYEVVFFDDTPSHAELYLSQLKPFVSTHTAVQALPFASTGSFHSLPGVLLRLRSCLRLMRYLVLWLQMLCFEAKVHAPSGSDFCLRPSHRSPPQPPKLLPMLSRSGWTVQSSLHGHTLRKCCVLSKILTFFCSASAWK